MKSILIYFSLTGNTKKIAYAIYKGMSQLSEQCDILTIKEVDVGILADYDLIGIGAPVWSAGPPPNVKRLINTMPKMDERHAFAFSTHGAWPEGFFQPMVKSLEEKGLKVIGINDWYGTVNLPTLPKPYLTDGHPDEIDLEEAEVFGKDMLELSQKLYSGELKSIPSLKLPPFIPIRRIKRPLPKLIIHKCRYPECRLCMDHCAADSIDLSQSPPVFAKNCSTCHFCEMICPEGAIEVDYESQVKALTQRAKEDFLKALDKAEAEGRFRRLVQIEDIGWDTPYEKIYKTHPRYVIPEE